MARLYTGNVSGPSGYIRSPAGSRRDPERRGFPAGRRTGEPAVQGGRFRAGTAMPDRRRRAAGNLDEARSRRVGGADETGCTGGSGFGPSGPFQGLCGRGAGAGGPDRREAGRLGESRGSDTVGAERSRRPPDEPRLLPIRQAPAAPRLPIDGSGTRAAERPPMTCRVRIASVKARCVRPPRIDTRTAPGTSHRHVRERIVNSGVPGHGDAA